MIALDKSLLPQKNEIQKILRQEDVKKYFSNNECQIVSSNFEGKENNLTKTVFVTGKVGQLTYKLELATQTLSKV